MKGKLGRYLDLDEHLALGVDDRLVSRLHPSCDLGGAVGFHGPVPARAASQAWDDFVDSRKDRPYPIPEMPDDGEGEAKQRALEERYSVGRSARGEHTRRK